jgi:hypothetical protein
MARFQENFPSSGITSGEVNESSRSGIGSFAEFHRVGASLLHRFDGHNTIGTLGTRCAGHDFQAGASFLRKSRNCPSSRG